LASFSLLAGLGYILYYLPQLPDEVPIHLNARGEVDGWGSPWLMLLLPMIGLGLWIGLSLVQRNPEMYNYPVELNEDNQEVQYALAVRFIRFIKASTMILFAYICKGMVGLALNETNFFGFWILPVIFVVLFAGIGTYIWFARKYA
jgi:uncharacterized membrane protein